MLNHIPRLFPGLLLCCGITLLAGALQIVEKRLVGQAYLEALVLVGVAVRTVWRPDDPRPTSPPGIGRNGGAQRFTSLCRGSSWLSCWWRRYAHLA
jgi:hypothetical protein